MPLKDGLMLTYMNSYDDLGDRLLTQEFLLVVMGLSNLKVAALNGVPGCLKIRFNEFLLTRSC